MQLRWQIVLPLLHLGIALALSIAPLTSPVAYDTIFIPTAIMVRDGLNAPALFLRALVPALGLHKYDQQPAKLAGVSYSDLFFLLGVIVVWHLVGRSIDARQAGTHCIRSRTMTVVRSLCLVLVGVVLLWVGALPGLVQWGRYNNPTGNLASGVLHLSWSMFLLSSACRDIWQGLLLRRYS